jgi:hypothetical protein
MLVSAGACVGSGWFVSGEGRGNLASLVSLAARPPRSGLGSGGLQPARCDNAPAMGTCQDNPSVRRVARGAPASAGMPGSRPSASLRDPAAGRARAGPDRRDVTTRRSGPAQCDSAPVPARQLSDGRDSRAFPGFARPAAGRHPITCRTHDTPRTHLIPERSQDRRVATTRRLLRRWHVTVSCS